ncbi:MAG: hypothetical protein K8F91_22975 [Candidatus Obscuribacterales bacterium]|nr:hypothetical protein [Candidatus Obscuribacterales bacterium]
MFSKATIITITATVVILLSGAITAVVYFGSSKAPVDARELSPKLLKGIELPPDSKSIRMVDFYPDGTTRKQATEHFEDGSVSHYWFRPDGTLEKADTVGAEDDNGKRPTLRLTQMEPDGRTFRSDTEWYPDGQLRKQVELADDGKTTSRQYYFGNGQTETEQIMVLLENAWMLTRESSFHKNGSKARTFLIGAEETTDMLFNEQEVPIVVKVHNKKLDQYSERWFADDGKTPKRVVDQNDQGTLLAIKGEGGVDKVQVRWSGEVKDSMLEVTFYDESGRKFATQSWWFMEGKRILRAVMFFDEDGNWSRQYLIETSGAGAGKIEADTIFQGDSGFKANYTRREYAPDGTLKLVTVKGADGEISSKTEHTSGENIAAEIDPRVEQYKLFELTLPELPPQVIEFVPQGD